MDQCTKNYECLVVHNNAKSNKLTDQVFWYKADQHDDYKLCSPEHWTYSDNNMREDEGGATGEYNNNSSKYTIKKQWS